jgi:hypothetical protein
VSGTSAVNSGATALDDEQEYSLRLLRLERMERSARTLADDDFTARAGVGSDVRRRR